MKNIHISLNPQNKSLSLEALHSDHILKNTRFINDVISRSCRRDGCIYIKPVTDTTIENITSDKDISQTEYRALTGRRLKEETMGLINFPLEWIAQCLHLNKEDASHIISSMYKNITLQANMGSSPLAQRFPLSINILLHSFLLNYFTDSNNLAEKLIHIISQEIKMEYYKVASMLQNTEDKEEIISFLSSFTSFDDAFITTEIIITLLNDNIPPSISFPIQLSSLQLMSQSWENSHKMLTYILFNTHLLTSQIQ